VGLTYSIDVDNRLVTLSGARVPDIDEWHATMRKLLADPGYQRGFYFLTDRRLAEEAPTADYLRRAVSFLDVHRTALGQCRWALVVNGPAAYGMGRMAEALCIDTTVEMRVFIDMVEAQNWLGLHAAEVRG
jgi:hypothetical protein